jgi:hypothetical protein
MNTNYIELLNPARNWKVGTFGHLNLLNISGNTYSTYVDISKNLNVIGNVDISGYVNLNSAGIIYGPNNIIIDPFVHDSSGGDVIIKGSLDIKDKLHVENINFSNHRPITDLSNNNNHLTTETDFQDLSNIIFDNLMPRRLNSRIMIHLKINYFCSVAYSERISIQLWRNNVLLNEDISLGTINATGGFKNTYTLSFMDIPNNLLSNKYYIKYKLENNVSLVPQGIVDINTSSSIVLYEIS